MAIFHGVGRLRASAGSHRSTLASPFASSSRGHVGCHCAREQLCLSTRSPAVRPKPGLQAQISPCASPVVWVGLGWTLGGKAISRELTFKRLIAPDCSLGPIRQFTLRQASRAPRWRQGSAISAHTCSCAGPESRERDWNRGCRLRAVNTTKTAHNAHPRHSLKRVWDTDREALTSELPLALISPRKLSAAHTVAPQGWRARHTGVCEGWCLP